MESYAYLVIILSAAVMGLLAMWITFRPPSPRNHWLWMAAFAGLSAMGIAGAIIDHRASEGDKTDRDKKTAFAQQQLKTAMDRLATSAREIDKSNREIERVGALNTELQRYLLEQTHGLTRLSHDAINTTTGGNSFCYLTIAPYIDHDSGMPTIVQVGQYPLHDVVAEVIDIKAISERIGMSRSFVTFETPETTLHIGNMAQQSMTLLDEDRIPFTKGDSQVFRIRFSAQNGFWEEQLHLRRLNGKWLQIMTDKGLVVRDESERAHVYASSISEQRTQRQLLADLMDRAFGGSPTKLVMQALSGRKANSADLNAIRELLDTLEGEGQ